MLMSHNKASEEKITQQRHKELQSKAKRVLLTLEELINLKPLILSRAVYILDFLNILIR
jgi:hypothetical protein